MQANSITSATRSALNLLVEIEQRRVGSRDIAFDNVAGVIGSSASWVKKFVSQSGEVKEPRISLFCSIRAAYENLCTRVEQEHQTELARMALLKREIDAVTGGFVEMVQDNARSPTSPTRHRRNR